MTNFCSTLQLDRDELIDDIRGSFLRRSTSLRVGHIVTKGILNPTKITEEIKSAAFTGHSEHDDDHDDVFFHRTSRPVVTSVRD